MASSRKSESATRRSSQSTSVARSNSANTRSGTRTLRPSRMPSHEQIADRAYHIWLEKGRPQGQDMENWQQAEQELMGG